MNKLYRFLACSLLAAGAQLTAGAQALPKDQFPFQEGKTYFVKVGGGKAGYIAYNQANKQFDLVNSVWDADPIYFVADENRNEFQLYVGSTYAPLGAANANNGTKLTGAEDAMKFTVEKVNNAYKFRSTVGNKGYLNNYKVEYKLAFWEAPGDFSTVVIEEADYKKLYEEAKAQFKPFAENNNLFGTGAGTYSRPTELAEAMNAYNFVPKPNRPYEPHFNKLKAALRQIHQNMPLAGDFFRIQSSLKGEKFLSIETNNEGILKVVSAQDDNTLFYYDGQKLTSYATGQGLVNEANNIKRADLGEHVNDVTFAKGDGMSQYVVTTGDRQLIFRGDEEHTRGGHNTNYPARNLKLVPVNEVSLNIGATGYATFFAHHAMKLSDTSVKIYVAKKTSATQVELVELEDHIIPAATAVILKADGAKALTLTVTDEAGDKTKAAGNLLKGYGYSLKTTAGKATYALAFNKQENKVQFGLVENGVALPAFKAYIELDNTAGATAPLFIALPTAVEAAKVQTTKAGATYDLTGRRVQQTAKGQVYVRDGKKFVQQ